MTMARRGNHSRSSSIHYQIDPMAGLRCPIAGSRTNGNDVFPHNLRKPSLPAEEQRATTRFQDQQRPQRRAGHSRVPSTATTSSSGHLQLQPPPPAGAIVRHRMQKRQSGTSGIRSGSRSSYYGGGTAGGIEASTESGAHQGVFHHRAASRDSARWGGSNLWLGSAVEDGGTGGSGLAGISGEPVPEDCWCERPSASGQDCYRYPQTASTSIYGPAGSPPSVIPVAPVPALPAIVESMIGNLSSQMNTLVEVQTAAVGSLRSLVAGVARLEKRIEEVGASTTRQVDQITSQIESLARTASNRAAIGLVGSTEELLTEMQSLIQSAFEEYADPVVHSSKIINAIVPALKESLESTISTKLQTVFSQSGSLPGSSVLGRNGASLSGPGPVPSPAICPPLGSPTCGMFRGRAFNISMMASKGSTAGRAGRVGGSTPYFNQSINNFDQSRLTESFSVSDTGTEWNPNSSFLPFSTPLTSMKHGTAVQGNRNDTGYDRADGGTGEFGVPEDPGNKQIDDGKGGFGSAAPVFHSSISGPFALGTHVRRVPAPHQSGPQLAPISDRSSKDGGRGDTGGGGSEEDTNSRASRPTSSGLLVETRSHRNREVAADSTAPETSRDCLAHSSIRTDSHEDQNNNQGEDAETPGSDSTALLQRVPSGNEAGPNKANGSHLDEQISAMSFGYGGSPTALGGGDEEGTVVSYSRVSSRQSATADGIQECTQGSMATTMHGGRDDTDLLPGDSSKAGGGSGNGARPSISLENVMAEVEADSGIGGQSGGDGDEKDCRDAGSLSPIGSDHEDAESTLADPESSEAAAAAYASKKGKNTWLQPCSHGEPGDPGADLNADPECGNSNGVSHDTILAGRQGWFTTADRRDIEGDATRRVALSSRSGDLYDGSSVGIRPDGDDGGGAIGGDSTEEDTMRASDVDRAASGRKRPATARDFDYSAPDEADPRFWETRQHRSQKIAGNAAMEEHSRQRDSGTTAQQPEIHKALDERGDGFSVSSVADCRSGGRQTTPVAVAIPEGRGPSFVAVDAGYSCNAPSNPYKLIKATGEGTTYSYSKGLTERFRSQMRTNQALGRQVRDRDGPHVMGLLSFADKSSERTQGLIGHPVKEGGIGNKRSAGLMQQMVSTSYSRGRRTTPASGTGETDGGLDPGPDQTREMFGKVTGLTAEGATSIGTHPSHNASVSFSSVREVPASTVAAGAGAKKSIAFTSYNDKIKDVDNVFSSLQGYIGSTAGSRRPTPRQSDRNTAEARH